MEKHNIGELIRQAETAFNSGSIQKSAYVSVDMKADLDQIDAYLNSKHISGLTDSIGREKPFLNIVLALRNIYFRATDIDRKNIRTRITELSQELLSYVALGHLQKWMRENNFGQFLNNWGLVLAGYNSAVVKFVEKDGKLHSNVIDWHKFICDPLDFDNNPKIEKLYFTPAQLRKNKSYDQDMVEELIRVKGVRKTIGDQQIDQKADFIEVYEIHGELELSYLTDKEEDEETYQQQMHAASFVKGKGTGKYNEYTLYSGRESRDPYLLTSLLPATDGSVSLNGSVKNSFDAQWMVNDGAKMTKDMLELATKILMQTSDTNFQGRNSLTNMDQGDILIHAQNQPLTQLNNKADIAPIQAFGDMWKSNNIQSAGISESMLGETPPSGTAWRQVQALLQESHSLFKVMRQNKALAIEEMLNRFIAPYIKKKMDTVEEIAATLESHQIRKIDKAFIPGEAIRVANEQIKSDILNGKMTQAPDMSAIESQIQAKLSETGNTRYIKPSEIKTKRWKEIFKDFELLFECDPTDEIKDNQAMMATFDTALKFMMGLQGRPMTATEELLFNKLISQTGFISPVELSQASSEQAPLQGQPAVPQAPVGAGKLAINTTQ